jgi:uncharacterized protein
VRVDSHIHTFSPGFFPSQWFDAMADRWVMAKWPPRPKGAIRDRIEEGMMDPSGEYVKGALDAASIDRAIWMGLDPWVFLRGTSSDDDLLGSGVEHLLRQVALVRAGEGRFVGVAGIDPRRPDVAELAAMALDDFGMVGVKIYPPHGYFPQSPECAPLYEACVRRGGVAVVHSAAAQYPLVTHYSNPLYLQEVQLAYPSLTIIVAHAGYPMWWREAATVTGGHPSTFLEISHWDRLIDNDHDELLRILRYWRDAVGAHRILFGTDYYGGPRFTGRSQAIARWANFIAECGVFSEDEVALIMGDNAARIIPQLNHSDGTLQFDSRDATAAAFGGDGGPGDRS